LEFCFGVGVQILDVGTIVGTGGQPHTSRALGPWGELSAGPPDGQEAAGVPEPLSTSLPDIPQLSTPLPSVSISCTLSHSTGTSPFVCNSRCQYPQVPTLITCMLATEDLSSPVSFSSNFTKTHSNRLSVNFSPFMEPVGLMPSIQRFLLS